MDHRRLWLLPITLLALDACVPTSTPGALGNGAFSYVCTNGNDEACNGVSEGSIALPAVIAVGASFSVTYQPASGVTAGRTEVATPSILGGGDGSFAFVSAGTAGILVPGTGGIVDFAELQGADVARVSVSVESSGVGCQALPPSEQDGGADAGLPDAGPAGDGGSETPALGPMTPGTTQNLVLTPLDSAGVPLAGDVPAQLTSADPGIVSVSITPPVTFLNEIPTANAFQLCAMAVGSTTITATLGGVTLVLPVTVQP